MNYLQKKYPDLNVTAEIAIVEPHHKVKEMQVMMHLNKPEGIFSQQLQSFRTALVKVLTERELQHASVFSARWFLTDPANQQVQISAEMADVFDCPVCYIKQPLLDGSKMALWMQLHTDMKIVNDGLSFHEHNNYRHYYTTDSYVNNGSESVNSYEQTKQLLEIYEKQLSDRACTIERDCLRTWFFVRDVDVNYQGVVEARKDNFRLNGLTENTHYIASTGIEGSTGDPDTKVVMDTYAVKGLDEGQVKFLYAKEYLSPTYDYGVTFERGVSVDFGDRRKVYISGTASINHEGTILHPGDVEKQVCRMWENVEALLQEAECSFDDLMLLIVYLRDIADYQSVKRMFDEKFADTPKLIVLAPICRPGWLVEMECIAAKPISNNNFRDF